MGMSAEGDLTGMTVRLLASDRPLHSSYVSGLNGFAGLKVPTAPRTLIERGVIVTGSAKAMLRAALTL